MDTHGGGGRKGPVRTPLTHHTSGYPLVAD